jgi:hypothetical protein
MATNKQSIKDFSKCVDLCLLKAVLCIVLAASLYFWCRKPFGSTITRVLAIRRLCGEPKVNELDSTLS